MDYIELLKQQNVTFQEIDEKTAGRIMEKEYSYHKLLEYSSIFPKYGSGEKEGEFVKLDFSQLYYLAIMDFQLIKIVMNMCLEIEKILKTQFIFHAEQICDTNQLLQEYYNSDKEYLDQTYCTQNMDILQLRNNGDCVGGMQLEEFLDVMQLGTFERLFHFFYKEYAPGIFETAFAPYEKQLGSVRRMRNMAAHNNSIIANLNLHHNYEDYRISAYLGKKGIKNRTLHTNMAKAMIYDLTNLLYVYFGITLNGEEMISHFAKFEKEYWGQYEVYFKENELLCSAHRFVKSVIEILSRKNQKSC